MEFDFNVTSYSLTSQKVQTGMKILMLGDLHCAEHGPHNSDLIAACKALQPDLILCVGDLIVGKPDTDKQEAIHLAEQLTKLAPVYAVNGNHETQLRRFSAANAEYSGRIRKSGVQMLNNSKAEIVIGGNRLTIYGLELPEESYRKLRIPRLDSNWIQDHLGVKPNENQYTILLAHNPQFARQYFQWGADLTLSGHFHGGVMRIGRQCLLSPYGFPLPKYGYGKYVRKKKSLIVTSGLGEHTIPFRLHNPMEIVSIEIKPEH